jgi:hypothetical protein
MHVSPYSPVFPLFPRIPAFAGITAIPAFALAPMNNRNLRLVIAKKRLTYRS